ncbi:putative cAMP-specific phosphodiesterase [Leptomonas pyrrhocoris]|uniref:Putative cAMP-specific phosphodiesterase n=1 Tax=Leptomonas pyrrhocoris TaxID=157538 RepID=A0A0N0DQL2_LEPPY|nr:putative cAMP-specific phosphodiesterase [Leptomonas pyrrhocoris]XP_015651600.1 putative cAMP-specific phosphodiesterase [Leptomonas pyrrhocoris]KPA73160.1 putative cAMP-specific phosphodiesterase [Leptomonas pyrrhocoris]KPA73161.1 putative cAMP-specific phosphodiesterase [Leptomonas pyrrhocoris]|eukprot:XP_015651599.1 putative cAMP-specific phosphodiesterase [Leptomonas pyrrhocoris]
MTQLPPFHTMAKRSPLSRNSDSKADPYELLAAVKNDPALPVQLKEKIATAMGRLRETQPPTDPPSPHRVTVKSSAHHYFEHFVSGNAPLHFCFSGNPAGRMRAKHFDIASSKLPGALLLSTHSTVMQRDTPALQNPKEVFDELNRIAMQTLRYIEEVEEMEFDVTNLREHDGSVMEDSERLFLSVCCSVFANFSFFTTLHINAGKFFHFLGELFTYYPTDNRYHNSTHAADALQMMSLFFREPSVNFLFTDEEIATCFLAVLSVDVAHPGATDALLVALDHPLASVFGDAAIAEHASLLVMTSILMRDDNFFLLHDDPNPIDGAHLVKEALYDVVMNATPRCRPALMTALHKTAQSDHITDADTPKLMAALLIMASNSFAFRTQAQFCRMGAWLLSEYHREECEAQRHSIPATTPHIKSAEVFTVLVDYINVMLRPIMTAALALVPIDLRDRLEANIDVRGAATGERFIGPLVESSSTLWSTSSVSVMEILKKVAAHANSVDRKASRGAILNASPARTSGTVPWMMRADSFSSISSASESMNVTKRDEPVPLQTSQSLTSQLFPSGSSTAPRLGRSEHYFSFLRLYDKCERAGDSAKSFMGQLLFLALQLDPRYIAAYARKAYGEDCSGSDCAEMGLLIAGTEEAPSSAEVIASRVPGGSFSTRAADEVDHTDGFVLFLMEMYSSREEALNAMEHESVTDDGTQGAASTTERITFEAVPPCQRNSPIRLPVNTESRTSDVRHRLVP